MYVYTGSTASPVIKPKLSHSATKFLSSFNEDIDTDIVTYACSIVTDMGNYAACKCSVKKHVNMIFCLFF